MPQQEVVWNCAAPRNRNRGVKVIVIKIISDEDEDEEEEEEVEVIAQPQPQPQPLPVVACCPRHIKGNSDIESCIFLLAKPEQENAGQKNSV